MTRRVAIDEAKTRLSELADCAARGEEIVITKAGRPVARLLAVIETRKRRQPGRGRGRITIAPDFDAPLAPDVLRDFCIEE